MHERKIEFRNVIHWLTPLIGPNYNQKSMFNDFGMQKTMYIYGNNNSAQGSVFTDIIAGNRVAF
jgi:hypothetical protein